MGQMTILADAEMATMNGGGWWNVVDAAIEFIGGAIAGWNAYQPRERVWSTIQYEYVESKITYL